MAFELSEFELLGTELVNLIRKKICLDCLDY